MDFHWCLMAFNGFLMDFNGFILDLHRNPIEIHWHPLEINGIPIEIHGHPLEHSWKSIRNQWRSIRKCGLWRCFGGFWQCSVVVLVGSGWVLVVFLVVQNPLGGPSNEQSSVIGGGGPGLRKNESYSKDCSKESFIFSPVSTSRFLDLVTTEIFFGEPE